MSNSYSKLPLCMMEVASLESLDEYLSGIGDGAFQMERRWAPNGMMSRKARDAHRLTAVTPAWPGLGTKADHS